MSIFRSVVLVAIALLVPRFAMASDYPIDLATHPGGDVTTTISPGRIRVVVFHRLPGRNYSVDIVRETLLPPPLDLPAGVNIPKDAAVTPECLKLKTDVDAIAEPTDETQVGDAAEKLAALLRASPCTGAVRTSVEARRDAYDNRLPQPEYDVAAGQQLRVTIRRLSKAGAPEKTWTTILTTGARGEWLTTYGMSFAFLRDELFFSKAGENEGEFVITKQREDAISQIKYLPTVLFSWMPASQKNRALAFSPTAGFAVSDDNFGVVGGVTATYNTNLGFTVGVAITRQRKLLGNYAENQVVMENLTEESLHHNVLKPAVFAAITFRFGSNPFASGDEEEESESEEEEGEATPVTPPATPPGGTE
jgi:hypothetical protein